SARPSPASRKRSPASPSAIPPRLRSPRRGRMATRRLEEADAMLLLVFRVAEDAYAIEAGRVVEVVPRVALRRLPHAPEALAGVFRYRGRVVPVIELGVLL